MFSIRSCFASAVLTILLTSVSAFSQSVETLIGAPDAIASPFILSGIQFRDDGKTLVGIGPNNTMVAWTLPEGKATTPPEKWRMYDAPMGTYFKVDHDYNVVVTLAGGRTSVWGAPNHSFRDFTNISGASLNENANREGLLTLLFRDQNHINLPIMKT